MCWLYHLEKYEITMKLAIRRKIAMLFTLPESGAQSKESKVFAILEPFCL
jgi:hypothetical protein